METKDILDYSTEKISNSSNVGLCELRGPDGLSCKNRGYYYDKRVYSVFREYLCEDHLIEVGVSVEVESLL